MVPTGTIIRLRHTTFQYYNKMLNKIGIIAQARRLTAAGLGCEALDFSIKIKRPCVEGTRRHGAKTTREALREDPYRTVISPVCVPSPEFTSDTIKNRYYSNSWKIVSWRTSRTADKTTVPDTRVALPKFAHCHPAERRTPFQSVNIT